MRKANGDALRGQYIADGPQSVKHRPDGTILIFRGFLTEGTVACSSLDKLALAGVLIVSAGRHNAQRPLFNPRGHAHGKSARHSGGVSGISQTVASGSRGSTDGRQV